jgi:hypothetical protein
VRAVARWLLDVERHGHGVLRAPLSSAGSYDGALHAVEHQPAGRLVATRACGDFDEAGIVLRSERDEASVLRADADEPLGRRSAAAGRR